MIPDDEHTRYAYREMATPSMFAFSLAIMVAFTLSFTVWDPWGLQETLNAMQRLGFSAAVGLFDILICYSAAVLALYVARRRTRLQALLTLSAMEIVVSVPCTAMWHTTFVLFHDGRPARCQHTGTLCHSGPQRDHRDGSNGLCAPASPQSQTPAHSRSPPSRCSSVRCSTGQWERRRHYREFGRRRGHGLTGRR